MNITSDSLVILTGASSGIGQCLARELITRYRCRVIGIARGKDRLDAVAQTLGERFEACPLDVGDRAAWKTLADRLTAEGKAVDMLINCAGVLPAFDRAENLSAEQLEQTLRINYLGGVYALEALKDRLFAAKRPIIVEISSAGGIAPLVGTAAYAASKAAATAYYSALREEWRGRAQVTVICPGFVQTDIFRNQPSAAGSEGLLRAIAMPANTCAKRILRTVRCGRGYRVLGADGHLLSIGMRLCPTLTLRACRRVMKWSGLAWFRNIWT